MAPVGNWWRYERQARLFGKSRRVQTFLVHRNGQQARAGSAQHFARALVARILHGDAIAAFDQYSRDQVQRLLRAADDDDLRRIAIHGTRAA